MHYMNTTFGGARKSYGGPVTYYCETCHLQVPPSKVVRCERANGEVDFYHSAIVSVRRGPFAPIKSDRHTVIEVPTHPSEV